ncbi:MAG TPA: creatininase family protein [bacterium]|nr:creatininase family protein [bacterium]
MSDQTSWLHERTWPEIKAYLERDDVVLLPVGSTEQHARHLPVMTDAAEAIAVAQGAGARAGVLVAPPVWYGWTPHHMAYPGTITLRAETLTAVVEDVCQSLFYHGFKRIIIINGHRLANLPPIEIAAVKVRNRTGGYVLLFDLSLSARVEIGAITSGQPGAVGHACEDETSQMLHSYGHLVKMSEARRAVHPPSGRFCFAGFATVDPAVAGVNFVWAPSTPKEFLARSGPTGVSGDPTLASPEKGRLIFEAQVNNLCELIAATRRVAVEMRPFDIPI